MSATSAALFLILWFDTEIIRAYFYFDIPGWMYTLEDFVSGPGNKIIITIELLLVIWAGRKFILHTALACAIQFAVVQVIKHIVGRVRPCDFGDSFLFAGPNLYHLSYPSGHTAMIWTLCFILHRCYPRLFPVWIGLALLISWGRIHALAHFAGDIFAGIIIAYALEQIIWKWLNSTQTTTDNSLYKSDKKTLKNNGYHTKLYNVFLSIQYSLVITIPVIIVIIFRSPFPAPQVSDTRILNEIKSVYRQILLRDYDEEAVAVWTRKLKSQQIIDLVREFSQCQEFYGSIQKLPDPSQRLNAIYQRILSRPATEAEMQKSLPLLADKTNNLHTNIQLITTRILLSDEYAQHFRDTYTTSDY